MGYLLVAWVVFSNQGSIPVMKWTPVDKFYATSNDDGSAACMRAGAELKVQKFKCVKFYN
jgi:hypothetical protein